MSSRSNKLLEKLGYSTRRTKPTATSMQVFSALKAPFDYKRATWKQANEKHQRMNEQNNQTKQQIRNLNNKNKPTHLVLI